MLVVYWIAGENVEEPQRKTVARAEMIGHQPRGNEARAKSPAVT
jgi:hypothetical protein